MPYPRHRMQPARRHSPLARHALAPALLVAAAVAALAFPANGVADCGGPQSATAAHRVAGQLPPLAIGDSTMLLSVPGLAAAGYDVNAQGCRQFYEGVTLMAQLKSSRLLPRMVVLALGANGPIRGSDVSAALKLLGPDGLLVLVTSKNVQANVALDFLAAREDPRHVLVLDWAKYSAGQSFVVRARRPAPRAAGCRRLQRLSGAGAPVRVHDPRLLSGAPLSGSRCPPPRTRRRGEPRPPTRPPRGGPGSPSSPRPAGAGGSGRSHSPPRRRARDR